MTKFGQAEYGDFMARMFADKLDEILETTEKQNFNRRNTEDIYKEFVSSKDAALVLSISLDTFYSNKNYATRKI